MKILNFILAASLLASALVAKAQPNAPDIVVSLDGKGAFTSIQEAVMSVRDYKPTRVTIYVKNGVYNEKIHIPANKCDITIIGQSAENTIITYGDYASKDNMGTFRTSTVRIDGDGIRMENITIENSAGRVGQAVALHVEGDRCEFSGCRFLGNQDTMFNGRAGARQYFAHCYIEGTTDFIFGPATAMYEDCDILCKADSYITAASTPQNVPYGLIFKNCRIKAAEGVHKVYLGRPWREYAYTAFINCELPKQVRAEGWHNWGRTENEQTSRYCEYGNTGEGANSTQRVSWAKQLTDGEARVITYENVMSYESHWTPAYVNKFEKFIIKDPSKIKKI